MPIVPKISMDRSILAFVIREPPILSLTRYFDYKVGRPPCQFRSALSPKKPAK